MSTLLTVIIVLVVLAVLGVALSARIVTQYQRGFCFGWDGWWGSGNPA
jgi:hypothetical protein